MPDEIERIVAVETHLTHVREAIDRLEGKIDAMLNETRQLTSKSDFVAHQKSCVDKFTEFKKGQEPSRLYWWALTIVGTLAIAVLGIMGKQQYDTSNAISELKTAVAIVQQVVKSQQIHLPHTP